MDSRQRFGLVARACLAAVVGVSVAACGGGGGGGGSPPPGTIDITSANQDTLTRAGMVALQAGVLGSSLGVASGGSPVAVAAAAWRKRAAAVQPPLVENCTVSGTTTTVYDDRDNSGGATPGDVATITFNDCSEVAGEVTNGTIVATYTQIQLAILPATIGARISTNDLLTETATRSVAAQGGFDFLLSIQSLTTDSLQVSIPSALVLAITTPVYSDTVTLEAGYVLQSAYDANALPPGGTVSGRTSTTASGRVSSAVAAGTVQVNTLQPFVQYDVDPYPRSGQFEVVGKTGSLQAIVLSSTQVEIDLDADGNGVFEATKTVAWSDLF